MSLVIALPATPPSEFGFNPPLEMSDERSF
jgi:hypothetical protein